MNTYIKIYRWTLEEMRGAARFVYAYISRYCEKYGNCACSQERIAQDLKICLRTAKNCISALAKAGYISIASAGKRKERNTYTVNSDRAAATAARWMQANERERHKMPDVLRVYDWMQERFGASLQCLLVANLYQLQTSAEDAANSMHDESARSQAIFSSGVMYGQRELAKMCACSISQLKLTIAGLKSENVLEVSESNLNWKRSKLNYYLNVENSCTKKQIAGNDTCKVDQIAGNCTCNNTEIADFCTCKAISQPEIALVNGEKKPDFQGTDSKNAPIVEKGEFIYIKNSFSFSNNSAAQHCKKADFPAAASVENPETENRRENPLAFSQSEKEPETGLKAAQDASRIQSESQSEAKKKSRAERNAETLLKWNEELKQMECAANTELPF